METVCLFTLIWTLASWLYHRVYPPVEKSEKAFQETMMQTDTHWNWRSGRYYYGHALVLTHNVGGAIDGRPTSIRDKPTVGVGPMRGRRTEQRAPPVPLATEPQVASAPDAT